jgi:hypothetical protein
MGTSKGYIPPTRIKWANAKRAVTQMLNDRDASSIVLSVKLKAPPSGILF